MGSSYHAMNDLPQLSAYGKGDYLVLFGELFNRGYANGLVEEAERRGLTVVRATVGRREKDGQLRPLTSEESALISKPFINVPLEAGFDMESVNGNPSPIEQLADVKLSNWEDAKVDFHLLEQSRQQGVARFRKAVTHFMAEIEKIVPPGANIIFAHLMAGGVPRTKIVMPLMNRAFKGSGDRYLSSKKFWESDIGKLCALSFEEVTAQTLDHLIDLSAPIRRRHEAQGKTVSYLAYGYHGTAILIGDEFKWQTYTPYLQGFAKKHLEDIAIAHHQKGVKVCVYNCPEIMTNSSSIFQGVEVSLYPLIAGLQKVAPQSQVTQDIIRLAKELLKPEVDVSILKQTSDRYQQSALIQSFGKFDAWPMHTSQEQLELMLSTSDEMVGFHKDEKNLLTLPLSELVFRACGYLMFHNSWSSAEPTTWLNHDLIARYFASDVSR